MNRAVAVAMRDGPEVGLALVGPLIETGGLDRYHLAHAVRADLLRRTGRFAEATDELCRGAGPDPAGARAAAVAAPDRGTGRARKKF